MNKDEILKLVKQESLSPKDALNKLIRHSTRLGDIDVNLHSKPLICGFPTIERYEYLMEGEGNLVVLAARPGNGKTALACQIGLNVSEHSRVLLFSLEMKKETLKKRLISVISQVPIKKLGQSMFKDKIDKASDDLRKHQFDVTDESDLTIHDIISKVHDEHRAERLGLVIIDYIGIVKVNNETRASSIGEVAKRIKKEICDKLKIPVIILAQMNRGFDTRYSSASEDDDIRPTLADIGESSGIEHAADVVMFLHRPYLLNKTASPSEFKIYVCKNRNGEVKDFDLEFSQELTKFFDKYSF